MKGNARKARRRTGRLATVGLLLPLALASAAQTPLRWTTPQASLSHTPAPAIQPASKPAYRAPVANTLPLAAGFDVQQFEAMAQELVANQRVPGLAMAIVQNGQVMSARGYGITDVRAAEPVDAHTVFRLASLSKSFAGTITGLLVSEGALRWDSKLTDYMPTFRLSDPYAAQRVTVADLLSHRVGLTHNTYDRDLEGNAEYVNLVQKLANAPMSCSPGDCYAYQNIAFSLIGDVVFAATGQFFSESVSRRIFKPLGMNDASYGLEGIEASARWAQAARPRRPRLDVADAQAHLLSRGAGRRRQRQHQRHGAMADRAGRASSRRAAGTAAGDACRRRSWRRRANCAARRGAASD